jgi:hypothetical protein
VERDIPEPAGRSEAETAPGPDVAVASRPGTGDPRVDQALRGLDELADLPVTDHPQVFERIHGQLVDVLGELRAGQDRAAGQDRSAGQDRGPGYDEGAPGRRAD